MATARALRLRTFRVRSAVLAAAAAAVASLVALAPATSAAPQLSIADVQSRVAALNERAERITEAYDATRDRLVAVRVRQRIAAHELRRERARLVAADRRLAVTADATYRTGGLAPFVLGVATDPQSFLDESLLLDALSRSQADDLAAATAARHAVESARVRYDAQASAVRQSLARIAADRARIESLLAQARRLLASLRAEQRARLEAAQARTAASMTALRGSYHGPASGQAAVAVRFAYAQLGKPYVYGAAGPGSYDCSGLTMAAWGAAGVGLPHNAAAQQAATRPVSYADLQPGDLVFFGSPAYHVGLYIGGGRLIEAPHTGDVVKIVALSSMPSYSGAGRP